MKEPVKKGIQMYFEPDVARNFAELEQNDKNFRVAAIVDRVIMQETKHMADPLFVAELGGGAHPDRYHKLFGRLLNEPQGHMDWVDISPYMLQLAKEYLFKEKLEQRFSIISLLEEEILEYLKKLSDNSLHLAIMKYTIDHIPDIDALFGLLAKKLIPGGRLVSTIGVSSPELKSLSVNARFLYRGQEFPTDETRTLEEGEKFTVKFFKVSGDPNSDYLEGAETDKYYHSARRITELAQKHQFDVVIDDWKNLVRAEDREEEELDQKILVLRK